MLFDLLTALPPPQDFGNCIFFYYAQQRIVRRVRNDLMAAILRQARPGLSPA